MSDVTIDQVGLQNAVQDAVQREAQHVLREMLQDGAEYRAVLNVIRVFAAKQRGIVFGEGRGAWHIQTTTGLKVRNEAGDPLTFRSAHELLDWLLNEATPVDAP